MTVTVHPFIAEDWELMRALRLSTLADAPQSFGSSYAEERDRPMDYWRERAGSGFHLWAALDGEPAGTIGVRPEQSAGLIVSMWVTPSARGHGVGDLLLEAAAALAAGRGQRTLRLWVESENEPARALYARHGFEPTGATEPMRGLPGRIQLEMIRD